MLFIIAFALAENRPINAKINPAYNPIHQTHHTLISEAVNLGVVLPYSTKPNLSHYTSLKNSLEMVYVT